MMTCDVGAHPKAYRQSSCNTEWQALLTFQNKLWLKWPPTLFLQQEQGGRVVLAWLGACQLIQPQMQPHYGSVSTLPEGQDEVKGMRQPAPSNSTIVGVPSRQGT